MQLQYTRRKFLMRKLMISEDEENSLSRESPLHIAVIERNNRSVDILLKYMAMVGGNHSRHYKDIFGDIVDQKSFPEFLLSLKF